MCVPKIAKSFTCFQRSHSKKQFGYRNFPCLHILHFSLWSSDERQPSCPPVSPPPPPSLNSVPLSFLWTKIISAPHTLDLFLELVWIAILRKANDWLIFLRGEQRRRLIWNFRILLRAIVQTLEKIPWEKNTFYATSPTSQVGEGAPIAFFFFSQLYRSIRLSLIEQWTENQLCWDRIAKVGSTSEEKKCPRNTEFEDIFGGNTTPSDAYLTL